MPRYEAVPIEHHAYERRHAAELWSVVMGEKEAGMTTEQRQVDVCLRVRHIA